MQTFESAGGHLRTEIPAAYQVDHHIPRQRRRQRLGRPAGPAPAAAHAIADIAARLGVGELATVTCRLSRAAIESHADLVFDSAGISVAVDRPIVVQVVPKRNVEVVGAARDEVVLPPPPDVATFYFDVRPVDPGEVELWVVLRQGPAPMLVLQLSALAVADRPERLGTHHATAAATVAVEPLRDVEDVQWLRIIDTERGGRSVFRYELTAMGLGVIAEFESPPLRDVEAYVRDLYRRIEGRWLRTGEDVEAFQEELRELGGDLFSELFPHRLQELLWRHRRRIRRLMVLSTEPFVPWELVHLKEPCGPLPNETWFLGQLGLVRWLYGTGTYPPTRLHARCGRVRVLRPEYADPRLRLPETTAEELFLRQRLGAVPVDATEREVRRLLREGGFDVLHFAGHGVADTGDVDDAELLLAGRPEPDGFLRAALSARTVHEQARLAAEDGSGPLVVLNACQVGRLGHRLASLGGFADAFLSRGAGAFVSSLWSVGDVPARTFVEAFYVGLLEGRSVADATVRAREAARAAGDATWLAYVVYAHPAARLDVRERPGGC